ncbi:MAG: hypothetical protein J7M26_09680, partial [Armatimonadetes bacterium]|nr:hypothetical protein [Armatimonadota bacterium]
EGKGQRVEVFSEKGRPCSVYSPWPGGLQVTDSHGRTVPLSADEYGRPTFPTKAGQTYGLQPK